MSGDGSFDRTFYVEEQGVRLTPFVMHSGREIFRSARRHLDVVCLAYSQKLATVTRIFFPHPIPYQTTSRTKLYHPHQITHTHTTSNTAYNIQKKEILISHKKEVERKQNMLTQHSYSSSSRKRSVGRPRKPLDARCEQFSYIHPPLFLQTVPKN